LATDAPPEPAKALLVDQHLVRLRRAATSFCSAAR
jgi:hypothetical protein